jgi:hypothetical protein
MPGSVGAARRPSDLRRPRQPHQPWQRPHNRRSGRADRLADLDLALPHNAAGLDEDAHDIAAQASAAWEAAVCWDDEYAVRRLAEVRAL